MNTRTLTTTLACAAAVVLVGCDPAATEPAPNAPSQATTTPELSPSKENSTEKKAVPNFVGMGLQSAQDAAQAEGFYSLRSHDSAGRDRMQAFDRNWKVCSQNVKAGKTVGTDTTLDFGAVKLEETCPASDKQAPEAVRGKMPDLVGESVKAARGALDSGASITVTDSADDRLVLMESNWKVCTQQPAAGTALNGQPVQFTAVKFEESC
ncbi:hypothetical protein AB0935_30265 [Streptomyces sp. NPDC007027]|uniref:hypothetical protein n=1 Tax=Streptomyces sp. NPDC007027 TaxID=3157086 RepID=UPI0034565D83